ncbi:MAG: RNA methyltransferase [Bacteroidales bacterium]|nr:RNA methyltransferase [Bacteroidales bacterium]
MNALLQNATPITSLQNPKVKEAVLLQEKAREREKRSLFVAEGVREITAAISSGFEVETLFFCPDIISSFPFPIDSRTRLFSLPSNVYAKIAYRSTTEGVTAIVRSRHLTLEDLTPLLYPNSASNNNATTVRASSNKIIPANNPACVASQKCNNPLIIIAEAVEKPGNLGAILRTADAVGATAVLFCNPKTDLYNPNLIRASLGGVFTQKIVCCKTSDAIKWLKANKIKIYSAQLQDSVPYYGTDMTLPCAIALGSEADGISEEFRIASDKKIMIPMLGKLDSLNVSVSASILCYEALRQRVAKTQTPQKTK